MFLSDYKSDFEAALKNFWDTIPPIAEPLFSSMKYSVNNGGKRLRPALTRLGAEFAGGKFSDVFELAAAIEFIHCYSLVHDDLPAMDDDTLRRGVPTTHVKFGEGMAVLCGDGLLNFAYEIMLSKKHADARYYEAVKIISDNAGVYGMIKGQCLDIDSAQKSLETVKETYRAKTSCLLKGALLSGAAACGAGQEELDDLGVYADNAGVVFQIADDLLDLTSSAEIIGKNVGSDADKQTYIALAGVEKAKTDAAEMENAARKAVEKYGGRAEKLLLLLDFFSKRDR